MEEVNHDRIEAASPFFNSLLGRHDLADILDQRDRDYCIDVP